MYKSEDGYYNEIWSSCRQRLGAADSCLGGETKIKASSWMTNMA